MNSAAKFAAQLSRGQATTRPLLLLPRIATTRSVSTTTAATTTTTTTIGSDGANNGTGTGIGIGIGKTSKSMETAKTRLARASLKQVPRYGWTQEAITVAASHDPKLSISMSGMFSPTELVGWFMDDINQQLRLRKQEQNEENSTSTNTQKSKSKSNNNNDNNNQRFESIKWRLEQVLPFVESGQWHRGMAMGLSTPLTTQSQLHEFIELISPEDSGTAYHTALGAIFVATELHLLTDSSPGYAETWSFLNDRLNELEDCQRRNGNNGTIDPAQFLVQLASSTPVPSLASLGNMTNSIPVVAGLAVAQSLVEGAASLVMPQSFRVLPTQQQQQQQQQQSGPTTGSRNETTTPTTTTTTTNPSGSVPGTKASDYESPPTPPSSTR